MRRIMQFKFAQANNEVVYRAILPAGAKLVNSKDMGNAFRGFFRGADGIRGHANFVAVEAQKAQKLWQIPLLRQWVYDNGCRPVLYGAN